MNFKKGGDMLSRKRLFVIIATFFITFPLSGHFQMLLPETDIIEQPQQAEITLKLIFCHPFEGDVMNMVKPKRFGVTIAGETESDLLNTLKKFTIDNQTAWETTYRLTRPGDYLFYVEPVPYWEPSEEKFILHYTKVVVNGFGLEKGWDEKVGLRAEIVPLTRPYGLYKGNLFRGLVLVDGKPAPFIDVEVEYYNKDKKYKAPKDAYITQIIKTDANGIFSYAIPAEGWWGFAALTTAEEKLLNKKDGKYYPIEIGALIWVYARNMELR